MRSWQRNSCPVLMGKEAKQGQAGWRWLVFQYTRQGSTVAFNVPILWCNAHWEIWDALFRYPSSGQTHQTPTLGVLVAKGSHLCPSPRIALCPRELPYPRDSVRLLQGEKGLSSTWDNSQGSPQLQSSQED